MTMQDLHFASINFPEDGIEVKAPIGTRLLQVAEIAHADITFGCKQGSCGTCLIEIQSGKENLSAPSEEEKDFLEGLATSRPTRLACQVKIFGDCAISQAKKDM